MKSSMTSTAHSMHIRQLNSPQWDRPARKRAGYS